MAVGLGVAVGTGDGVGVCTRIRAVGPGSGVMRRDTGLDATKTKRFSSSLRRARTVSEAHRASVMAFGEKSIVTVSPVFRAMTCTFRSAPVRVRASRVTCMETGSRISTSSKEISVSISAVTPVT